MRPPPTDDAGELSPDVRDRVRAMQRDGAAPTRAPVAAPDPGRVLLALERFDGSTLRVSLHTYEGKPYVRIGPWKRDPSSGAWWPVKGKGATVRVRELGAVAAALVDAHDVARDTVAR